MPVARSLTILNRIPRAACLAAWVASALLLPSAASASLVDALSNGTVNADLRYRYEVVDVDHAARQANASTLRTRLGYTSAEFSRLQLFVEFENVAEVVEDNYNSTKNNQGGFPVVADPEGSEINQAHLRLNLGDTKITVGRQRIKLDNVRHVGNVGWRQNEQTYDAATVTGHIDSGLSYHYSYLWNVNDVKTNNTDVESHLINLRYNAASLGSLTVYGYLINNNDKPGASSQTYGGRYSGKFGAGATKVILNVENATQSEYQDATFDTVNYRLGELGVNYSGAVALVGYEVLEVSGGRGFTTPFATLHAFNGWTDQFLKTPINGLTDLYFDLHGKVAGVKLKAVFHDFNSDGSDDYGTELDLLAVKKVSKQVSVGVKYGRYDATGTLTGAGGLDVTKFWAFAQLRI